MTDTSPAFSRRAAVILNKVKGHLSLSDHKKYARLLDNGDEEALKKLQEYLDFLRTTNNVNIKE